MIVRHRRLVLVLAAAAVLSGRSSQAQSLLEPAISQYDAADYDGALAALDRVAENAATTTDRVAVDHYRVLCLLALGRTDDAESALRRVFTMHPGYTIDADTSPRVRALFDKVRARMLPELLRSRYAEAKAHFDARRFVEAGTGFAVVADLGRIAHSADVPVPVLDDLLQLAAGFAQLASAAFERERIAAAVSPSSPVGSSERERPAGTAAPAPAEPYTLGSSGVEPPVVVSQALSAWRSQVPRPRAGAPLGTVEVVIDETGLVVGARIVSSVSSFYDAMVLESVKSWRYRPALRAGRPVRFRRVVEMVAG